MSSFLIRSARPDDAASLIDVVAAAYAPWRARLPDLPDVTAGLASDIAEAVVWVAVSEDGSIVGGLVLVPARLDTHIANLAVVPEWAGKGVGQALLAQAESHTRANGQWTLRLTTHRDMAPTLRFYHRHGWTETARDGARVFLEKCLL